MLIFNTTYKVSNQTIDTWKSWMRQEHIPFMLADKLFSKPQIAKIIGSEDVEGTSFSVQFQIENMEKLSTWHQQNAVIFQNSFQKAFGTEVQFFSTVLEIVD